VTRCLLAACALALAAPSHAQDVSALARARGWRLDFESARAEARRANKPMFLVFRCEP
jgi:hypothetical protein